MKIFSMFLAMLVLLSLISVNYAAFTVEISKAPVNKTPPLRPNIVVSKAPPKPAPLVCSPGKVLYAGGIYTTITIICG